MTRNVSLRSCTLNGEVISNGAQQECQPVLFGNILGCVYVWLRFSMYVRVNASAVCLLVCVVHVCDRRAEGNVIYGWTYVILYACVYIWKHACIHSCMSVCRWCVDMHVCMYLCVHVCVYDSSMCLVSRCFICVYTHVSMPTDQPRLVTMVFHMRIL